jgi:hypothetical protein
MRKIKFRAWDGTTMHYPSNFEFGVCGVNGETSISIPLENGGFTTTAYIMQSTGVQDTNGRDIYEGDVLYWSPILCISMKKGTIRQNIYAEVVWGYTGFTLRRLGKHRLNTLDLENGRVIGNIYEQPEIEKPRWEDPND